VRPVGWRGVRVLGVIPARYGSTRFPGKALADLAGKPLLAHVIDRVREAGAIDRVLVATDDDRIARVAEQAGVEARMTPSDLPSGSDRVAHVLAGEGEDGVDLVVNIQGDEPLLPGEAMDRAIDALVADPDAVMATLAVTAGIEEVDDPNVVKVVLDTRARAIYFSRSRIPHGGGGEHGFLKHVGMYVFKPAYLKRFVGLGPGKLEQMEKLEQLRALEDGAAIAVAVGEWPIQSVDTPEDLMEAERKVAAMSGRR